MSNESLPVLDPAVVIEPPEAASATVIWLHGLGADGRDFEPLVPELGQELVRDLRFVFPHAPQRAVTINGGMRMRAWYDIKAMDLDRRADAEGVLESARILESLVAGEAARGIAPQRVVLAGFSQGGAIALHTALRHPEPLAGVLALSTYLPLAERLESEAHLANRRIPLFLGHGSQDPVVPLELNERTRRQLRANGHVVECHTYAMGHSVCAEEVRDIACWLHRVLR